MDAAEAIIRAALKGYVSARVFASVKTTGAYELHVWSYMRAYFTGDVNAFGFIDLMAAEVDNQLRRGWREGAEEMGVLPEDFTEDDNVIIDSMVVNEQNYLDGIAGDIEAFLAEGEHTDEEFSSTFRHRAGLWARGYQTAADQAKLHFGNKEKLEWVLGSSEESCETCLGLNGIVAWAREWDEAGVMPGGSMLACGGWQCHCRLERTDKRRTAGASGKIMDIMVSGNV